MAIERISPRNLENGPASERKSGEIKTATVSKEGVLSPGHFPDERGARRTCF